eukprot:7204966-Pyramimonas_sp.AAC.1
MVRRLLQDMSNSEAFKQLADPDSKLHKDLKLKEAKAMLKATKAAAREKEKAEKKKKSEAAKAAASLVTKSGPRWRRQKGAAKEKSASRPASSLKAAAATKFRKQQQQKLKAQQPQIKDVEVTEVQNGMETWKFVDFARSLVGEIERISPDSKDLCRQVWVLALFGAIAGSVPLYGANDKVVDCVDFTAFAKRAKA